jgi:hypothetical protein
MTREVPVFARLLWRPTRRPNTWRRRRRPIRGGRPTPSSLLPWTTSSSRVVGRPFRSGCSGQLIRQASTQRRERLSAVTRSGVGVVDRRASQLRDHAGGSQRCAVGRKMSPQARDPRPSEPDARAGATPRAGSGVGLRTTRCTCSMSARRSGSGRSVNGDIRFEDSGPANVTPGLRDDAGRVLACDENSLNGLLFNGPAGHHADNAIAGGREHRRG